MSERIEEVALSLKNFLKSGVNEDLANFNNLISWDEEDKREFRILLDELKQPFAPENQTTKQKGDLLERLVEFVITKSYFFEVYKNVQTETNEIDDVIVLSELGKQTLYKFGLSRDLIPIREDVFLGECKNYEGKLGVTYVGKFYSLMKTAEISFGVLFTKKGLTGSASGYKDAYGLTKVLRMIENNRNIQGRDFYILTFTIEDYEKMLTGTTFFDLIKAKKLEMKFASSYENFLSDNKHEAEDEVKKIIRECM